MQRLFFYPRNAQGGTDSPAEIPVGLEEFNDALASGVVSRDGKQWAYADGDLLSWAAFVEVDRQPGR